MEQGGTDVELALVDTHRRIRSTPLKAEGSRRRAATGVAGTSPSVPQDGRERGCRPRVLLGYVVDLLMLFDVDSLILSSIDHYVDSTNQII